MSSGGAGGATLAEALAVTEALALAVAVAVVDVPGRGPADDLPLGEPLTAPLAPESLPVPGRV